MMAMVRKAFGGPEQLVSKDVPIPTPGKGEVLLRVRAFGINHAELYMRQGVWGDVSIISGIECVGQVEHDPSGALAKGATVVTFMGGLGRTRPGSYAQYTTALAPHVVPVETSLGGRIWRRSPRPTPPPGAACSLTCASPTARHSSCAAARRRWPWRRVCVAGFLGGPEPNLARRPVGPPAGRRTQLLREIVVAVE